MTNVARHAGVGEVTVRLWSANSVLGIQVEDRGSGFDRDDLSRRAASTGLNGMRERAMLLGGHFEIDSIPGRGTCLTAELPAGE